MLDIRTILFWFLRRLKQQQHLRQTPLSVASVTEAASAGATVAAEDDKSAATAEVRDTCCEHGRRDIFLCPSPYIALLYPAWLSQSVRDPRKKLFSKTAPPARSISTSVPFPFAPCLSRLRPFALPCTSFCLSQISLLSPFLYTYLSCILPVCILSPSILRPVSPSCRPSHLRPVSIIYPSRLSHVALPCKYPVLVLSSPLPPFCVPRYFEVYVYLLPLPVSFLSPSVAFLCLSPASILSPSFFPPSLRPVGPMSLLPPFYFICIIRTRYLLIWSSAPNLSYSWLTPVSFSSPSCFFPLPILFPYCLLPASMLSPSCLRPVSVLLVCLPRISASPSGKQAMDLREERYGKAGYQPTGDAGDLFPGTFYLAEVRPAQDEQQ